MERTAPVVAVLDAMLCCVTITQWRLAARTLLARPVKLGEEPIEAVYRQKPFKYLAMRNPRLASIQPSIEIKLSRQYHIQGDQVSGEVLLDVPSPITTNGRLILTSWAVERSEWKEREPRKPKTKKEAQKGVPDAEPWNTTFSGSHDIYRGAVTLLNFDTGVIPTGKFLVPFAFYLPFKVAASTLYLGDFIECAIQHFIEVRLIPLAEICPDEAQAKSLSRNKTFKLDAFDVVEQLGQGRSSLSSSTVELVVLEKAGYQGSLKAYTWNCSYTISHVILGTRDLHVSIKKRFDPCVPGGEIPLWINIHNQSATTVTDVIVTLRHTVSLRSNGGTAKQLTYNHTQWRRPAFLRGAKSITGPIGFAFPLRLPLGLAPSSHGSAVTSIWEITVACRYRTRLTPSFRVTSEDIVFPLTIWAPNPLTDTDQETLKRVLVFEEKRREGGVAEDAMDEEAIEESLVFPDSQVKECPPIAFELTEGSDVPAVADMIRLKKRQAPLGAEGALKMVMCDSPDIFTASGQCRLDFGATLSPELKKSICNTA